MPKHRHQPDQSLAAGIPSRTNVHRIELAPETRATARLSRDEGRPGSREWRPNEHSAELETTASGLALSVVAALKITSADVLGFAGDPGALIMGGIGLLLAKDAHRTGAVR